MTHILSTFLLILHLGLSAYAGLPSYDSYFDFLFKTISLSNSVRLNDYDPRQKCDFLENYSIKNNTIDIGIHLGYFDISNGQETIDSNMNFGYSPSVDLSAFQAIRKKLTQPCFGKEILCQFKVKNEEIGSISLERKIRYFESDLLVHINLTHSSFSENFATNYDSIDQKHMSSQAQRHFINSLETFDIIYYIGHSRNGWGPDFSLPILNSQNMVDYKNHYSSVSIGKHEMINALLRRSQSDAPPVLGLFSCSSHRHFARELRAISKDIRLITSSETVDYFEALTASTSTLEALLRGHCGKSLQERGFHEEILKTKFRLFNL